MTARVFAFEMTSMQSMQSMQPMPIEKNNKKDEYYHTTSTNSNTNTNTSTSSNNKHTHYEQLNTNIYKHNISNIPPVLRLIRVIWSCLQNMFMGGTIYGYTALLPMLRASEDIGGMGLSETYIT